MHPEMIFSEKKGRAPSCTSTISPVAAFRAPRTESDRVFPPSTTLVRGKRAQSAEISSKSVSEAVTNCIVHGYRDADGWITIRCTIEGEKLHIEVSDSGRGIDDLEKALTPFYTTLPEEERSGMGFTIMQTFMSAFSVQSERGKGTTVKMCKDFGARTLSDAG